MTTLINAKPRFALEGDRLFCYLTSRYYPISGMLQQETVGLWDLVKVAELIRAGEPIELAYVPGQMIGLQAENEDLKHANADLIRANDELTAKLSDASQEIARLNTPETPQPDQKQADKVEQFVQDFNAATPPPTEGDKVEQAKADFLSATDPGRPGGDHSATVTAERQADGSLKVLDVQIEPKADIEGAMAPQEAPPKGE